MAFFNNLPYTNKHGLNDDWLIKHVEECKNLVTEYGERLDRFEEALTGFESDFETLSGTVAGIRQDLNTVAGDLHDVQVTLAEHGRILTSFQGTLESIEARLVIIVGDITNLYNSCSNLGARVTLLEAATIQPITFSLSPDSPLVSGLDLRYQPTGSDGFPLSMTFTPPPEARSRVGLRYNQDKGFVIPDNDTGANEFYSWYGDWPKSTNQADQYAITFRVYNAAGTSFTDYKFEHIVITDLGDGWHMIGDTGVQFSLKTGVLDLRWYFRQDSGANAGAAIRCIKIEHNATASAIEESRKDSDLQQIAAALSVSDSVTYSGNATFSMDFTCTPAKTWAGDNCKIVADLKKVGKILSGAVRLYIDTNEALTVSDLETASVEIDVSAWNIPALAVTSGNLLALQNDIVTGEQYKLSGFNADGILDHFLLQPHFTQITTAADGYFATIPLTVPLT